MTKVIDALKVQELSGISWRNWPFEWQKNLNHVIPISKWNHHGQVRIWGVGFLSDTGFKHQNERLILVHPVVEFKGIVSVHEVLFGLLFDSMLCSVKQLCSLFFIFDISDLVSLESFVMSFFFPSGGNLWIITGKKWARCQ